MTTLGTKITHLCQGNKAYGGVYWCEANVTPRWRMGGYWIEYCPHCGVKLEEPDAKIEVSQKELKRWANLLDAILSTTTYWPNDSSTPSRIRILARDIREVANG